MSLPTPIFRSACWVSMHHLRRRDEAPLPAKPDRWVGVAESIAASCECPFEGKDDPSLILVESFSMPDSVHRSQMAILESASLVDSPTSLVNHTRPPSVPREASHPGKDFTRFPSISGEVAGMVSIARMERAPPLMRNF